MTPTEQIGSAVFFFALIPALIIYGIGTIVDNIRKDDTEARERRTVVAFCADFFAEPDPHALADRAAMQAARSAR